MLLQPFLSVQFNDMRNTFLKVERFLDFDMNLKVQGFHFNDDLKKLSIVRLIWVITLELSIDTKFPQFQFVFIGATSDSGLPQAVQKGTEVNLIVK